MKKLTAILLVLLCLAGMTGCGLIPPDFDDFQDYQADFERIRDFLTDYNFSRNDAAPFIVDLNSQFLTVAGEEISDSSMIDSVKAVYDLGFTYVEITENYMIFWEDKTGYYGVLWSEAPGKAISNIVAESRPYMRSRRLNGKWYEVGALDSV